MKLLETNQNIERWVDWKNIDWKKPLTQKSLGADSLNLCFGLAQLNERQEVWKEKKIMHDRVLDRVRSEVIKPCEVFDGKLDEFKGVIEQLSTPDQEQALKQLKKKIQNAFEPLKNIHLVKADIPEMKYPVLFSDIDQLAQKMLDLENNINQMLTFRELTTDKQKMYDLIDKCKEILTDKMRDVKKEMGKLENDVDVTMSIVYESTSTQPTWSNTEKRAKFSQSLRKKNDRIQCCSDINSQGVESEVVEMMGEKSRFRLIYPSCIIWERWKALENTYKKQRDKETLFFFLDRWAWLNTQFTSWTNLILGLIDQLKEELQPQRQCLKWSLFIVSGVVTFVNSAIYIGMCLASADAPATWMKKWDEAGQGLVEDGETVKTRVKEILWHMGEPGTSGVFKPNAAERNVELGLNLSEAIKAHKAGKKKIFARGSMAFAEIGDKWPGSLSLIKKPVKRFASFLLLPQTKSTFCAEVVPTKEEPEEVAERLFSNWPLKSPTIAALSNENDNGGVEPEPGE